MVDARLAPFVCEGPGLKLPMSSMGDGDREAPMPLQPPDIPGFAVSRLIGQGGMGAVYEAWQEKPSRRVAIKLARPGVVSVESLRRLSAEADILGRLEHPSIARIYSAGSVASGGLVQPYLVMEYIEGQPVTLHIEQTNPGVEERLQLFRQILDGVQFAHQQGIIHRDLKPGNILVDQRGQPRILDFGIAWVTGSRPAGADAMRPGGTASYMAPEQFSADLPPADVRADIYALGLILFEMLTGHFPYDFEGVDRKDVARIIREQAPARLRSIDPRWAVDLDMIVAKALEKDRDARYVSASALDDDVRRYLRRMPVEARPYSMRYVAGLFARRHWLPVAAVSALFVAITAGLVSSSIGWNRARMAELKAEENYHRALDTIDQFTMFIADNQMAGVPGSEPLRERLLQDAVFLYESLLAENKDDDILQQQLAWANASRARFEAETGDVDRARDALERQIELTRDLLASKRGDERRNRFSLALSTYWLGRVMARREDKIAAEARFEEAYRLFLEVPTSPDGNDRDTQFNIAYLLGSWGQITADPVRQKAKYEEALARWRKLEAYSPNNVEIIRAIEWNEQRLKEMKGSAGVKPAVAAATGAKETRAESVRIIDALDLNGIRAAIGRSVRVRGRVQEVAMYRGNDRFTYVNFGRGTDQFFGVIHRNAIEKFIEAFGENLDGLVGRDVELAGVVAVHRERPELPLNQPAQIKVIDDPSLAGRVNPVIDAMNFQALRREAGRIVIMRGRVEEVGTIQNHALTYLNFPSNGEGNAAAIIQQFSRKSVEQGLGVSTLSGLKGKTVEVTGRVYFYKNNPNIEIDSASQIAIID